MSNNRGPIGTHFPARVSAPALPAPFARSIVRTNFDELVDDLFSSFFGNSQSMKDKLIAKGKFPKTDILTIEDKDGNKTLAFQIAVPGIDAEDINIDANFDEGTLSVSYNKETVDEKRKDDEETDEDLGLKKEYIYRELSHSSFFRSWAIPKETVKFDSEEDVTINLSQGVLTINLDFVEKKEEVKKDPSVKRLTIN